MPVIYAGMVEQHDPSLVFLAACVCALTAFAAIALLAHAAETEAGKRLSWLSVCATAIGLGVWSTHFVAMLAYSPGVDHGYDAALALAALLGSIASSFLAFRLALSAHFRFAAPLAGLLFGIGLAATHYLGATAFRVAGRMSWDGALVAASVIAGAAFSALGLSRALRASSMAARSAAAVFLVAAIGGLHFTGMAAMSVIPDPTIAVPPNAISPSAMAIVSAASSILIVTFSLFGLLNENERRRRLAEAERMRGLANAAVEGLLICCNGVVVTANDSFLAFVDRDRASVLGADLSLFFPKDNVCEAAQAAQKTPFETDLICESGGPIRVELLCRTIDFEGSPHIAIAVRDIRARQKAEDRIRFLAHHDVLTGLPNRSSCYDMLDSEIAASVHSERRLAVMLIDLDHFKEVNDLFGHAEGDAMLKSFARVVSSALGGGATLARLGGDEFAAILPGIADRDAAGRVARAILDAIKMENDKNRSRAVMSASIGIALHPADGGERETLLAHADMALYQTKAEKRGGYRHFDPVMAARIRDRRAIEQDLRSAIDGDELHLVYQPQTDISTNEIVGFEALLRWTHPFRGNIPPTDFIPIAEESRIMLRLDEWVLAAACREAAKWRNPLSISVNISAASLRNRHFPAILRNILTASGLDPARLELEVTETTLIVDFERALETMLSVKAMGVRIAMDDFGTGYSSLTYLRAFPFDRLKIDRTFIGSVTNCDQSATIVRAVLGLGRSLGLPVVAEGVETQEELRFLAGEHCDKAQGYLIGRPALIDAFVNIVDRAPKETDKAAA
ncbi:EAL domain-containing protein [Methylocystis iwaonis]|uniref:bifunctional diguanylate cyclase/phosphodiesterase n=1 Tax=Methylocystis iwaonis TaxID=2885079 RepID=UPI002E7BBA3F|nr:EAL domain-containing protein [Methylocystis iwaonis]